MLEVRVQGKSLLTVALFNSISSFAGGEMPSADRLRGPAIPSATNPTLACQARKAVSVSALKSLPLVKPG